MGFGFAVVIKVLRRPWNHFIVGEQKRSNADELIAARSFVFV